jgi:hypothetical protein
VFYWLEDAREYALTRLDAQLLSNKAWSRVFFLRQREGGINVGWCVYGGNYLLEKGMCYKEKNHVLEMKESNGNLKGIYVLILF